MEKYYRRKNVLITGASSGIGKLMALNIAKLGGNIINWDINPGAAEHSTNISSNGVKYKFYKVDLSNKDAIYRATDHTLSDFKGVDIIINCAGIVSGDYLQNLADDKIERTFAVNTLALFYITKAFWKVLSKATTAPKIVTIASAAGIVATAKQTDYSASKFAAIGFMNSLRAELKQQNSNIETLIVAPYYIDTGMFAGVKTKVPWLLPILKPEYVAMRIVKTIPTKRKRLIMPRFASVSELVISLPVCISDFIVNLFGLNESMSDFVGRESKSSKKK